MKKYYELVEKRSAAWVVLRAKYLASRGRRPVDGFGAEQNPRKALKAAEQDLNAKKKKFFATAVPCSREILDNLLGLLGLTSLGKILGPKPKAPDKAQYTFHQWGLELPLKSGTN